MALVEKRDAGFLAYWTLIQVLRAFPTSFRLKQVLSLSRACASLWLWLSPAERERTRACDDQPGNCHIPPQNGVTPVPP